MLCRELSITFDRDADEPMVHPEDREQNYQGKDLQKLDIRVVVPKEVVVEEVELSLPILFFYRPS